MENYIPKSLSELNLITNNFYTNEIDTNVKPKLVDIYTHMLGLGYNTQIWYGDADVYVHVEEVYRKYGNVYDALVIRNVVTCFDKNVIVVLIERESKGIVLCKTVHSLGKKNNYTFNDHRDWDEEGLDTLRDHQWNFGYRDLRSNTLVFDDKFLGFRHHYNNWNIHSYGCGFNIENVSYVTQETTWAHYNIVEQSNYTIRGKV